MNIRFLSAGDSHGPTMVGVIEGLPAGVRINEKDIARDLARRRNPYGRSSRQSLEDDTVSMVSGLWKGRTTGAPLTLLVANRGRTVKGKKGGALGTVLRPGHADFAGCFKYSLDSVPPVSERASARSTVVRVAIGAVAKAFLKLFSVETAAHVISIGRVTAPSRASESPAQVRRRVTRSPVYCADASASRDMVEEIRVAKKEGHSLGGSVEVLVGGVVPGLGSHVEWDRKLDARLSAAMMSIQSVKAVEIGDGISSAGRRGANVHDAMRVEEGRVVRDTNFAGGIEGGMTNGETVIVHLFSKPIPTAPRRVGTFDMKTRRSTESPYVRSDLCVVPALSVIAESVAAWEILAALLEKFGGDHIDDTRAAYHRYVRTLEERLGG